MECVTENGNHVENQKIDNTLNLAVEATPEEREKSLELNVGYNPMDRQWDVIVKYSGNIEDIPIEGLQITTLLNQYAVIRVPQSQLDALANLPQIEYVEKPKRLFFALSQARSISCINPVQAAPYNLHGAGILVACVDSGIDYSHPDFRNPDGSTRIVSLWDQTIPGEPPDGYFLGTEYTEELINEALEKAVSQNATVLFPAGISADMGLLSWESQQEMDRKAEVYFEAWLMRLLWWW